MYKDKHTETSSFCKKVPNEAHLSLYLPTSHAPLSQAGQLNYLWQTKETIAGRCRTLQVEKKMLSSLEE